MDKMDKYLKAVRDNICSICIDSEGDDGCTLSDKETCAIELFLPKIVEIIHYSSTDDIFALFNELQQKVCKDCKATLDGEYCYLREDSNCALDRYFALIVESIQKVDLENS